MTLYFLYEARNLRGKEHETSSHIFERFEKDDAIEKAEIHNHTTLSNLVGVSCETFRGLHKCLICGA